MNRLLIVGGGTAGWLTANLLDALLNSPTSRWLDITVIESAAIGRIGVGEATIPTLRRTFQDIGLTERQVLKATNATFKHGIRFEDWCRPDPANAKPHVYWHAFERFHAVREAGSKRYYGALQQRLRVEGLDLSTYWWRRLMAGRAGDYASEVGIQPALCEAMLGPKSTDLPDFEGAVPYAYHLDAEALGDLLAVSGERRGIRRIVDDVVEVRRGEDGTLRSVVARQTGEIGADFFVDCTGFAGLLIEQTLQVPLISFGEHLLCDRAIAIPARHLEGRPLRPYTTSKAASAGWMWEIDLTTRTGSGYVYSSTYIDDNAAEAELRARLGPRAEGIAARKLRMRVGRRAATWSGNCVAIGLSAGFIEPLESTGIYMIEVGARWLAEHISAGNPSSRSREHYNRLMARQFEEIRDFVVLHYCITDRDDTPFWREVRQASRIPDSLQEKLDLWSESLPTALHATDSLQVFAQENYESVLFGMGWRPRSVTARQGVRLIPSPDAAVQLLTDAASQALAELPSHAELLSHMQVLDARKRVSLRSALPALLAGARSPLADRQPGIRLSGPAGDPSRLRVTNGAVPSETMDLVGFKPRSWVPRQGWRAPTAAEVAEFSCPPASQSSVVTIVRPPADAIAPLMDAGRQAISNRKQMPSGPGPLAGPEFDKALAKLTELYGRGAAPPQQLGICINPPGLLTVTQDLTDGRRIGLHVDSWSGAQPELRQHVENRLCVNIGTEPRYLIIMPLTLRQVVTRLRAARVPVEAPPPEIVHRFWLQFPEQPLVAVRIDPGEAYIAPTEDVIHDGTSMWMTGWDASFTLLGHLTPPKESASRDRSP